MAMIKCPECGQDISDKAGKCIHCGKILIEEEKREIECPECGTIFQETEDMCPNCGCPVEREGEVNEEKPQQVEVASIKVTSKVKKITIGVVALILVCIVGGVTYKGYSDKKAEQNYSTAYNQYIDNLETAKVLMLTGGSDAESLCNLTLKVWRNSIDEKSDEETDAYTRPSGYFVKDFNEALENLFADSNTKATIYDIEDNQESVKKIMKKLQDVPEGLDKCYDTISELNTVYGTLTELAVNPTGSYNDFSTNKSNAISEFMAVYDKLDTQTPDKK